MKKFNTLDNSIGCEETKETVSDRQVKKFKNALEVTAYLQGQGWKVKRSSTYRHIQEGKLRPEADGAFTEKAALRYAKYFLKRLDGSTFKQSARAQQERGEMEGRKARAQARLWEMKAAILEGGYVPRAEFEMALAQRVTLFKNDLTSFCYFYAPEIINLVNGDHSKVGELIEAMEDKLSDVLGRYASKDGVTPLPWPNYGTEAEYMEKQKEFMEKTDLSQMGDDEEDDPD